MFEKIDRFTDVTPTDGPGPSHAPPDVMYAPGNGMAKALGWFSIGLGAAELFAPRLMSDLTGVRNQTLLQCYGLREIACGIGILASKRPAGWMWARVAGDALDLATLGGVMAQADGDRRTCALASAVAVAGVTALDVTCAAQLSAAAALEG